MCFSEQACEAVSTDCAIHDLAGYIQKSAEPDSLVVFEAMLAALASPNEVEPIVGSDDWCRAPSSR
jgi:hypothetical protein